MIRKHFSDYSTQTRVWVRKGSAVELERNRARMRADKLRGDPSSRDGEQRKRSERCETGAGDGLRTRYLDLGKVALYQVSYSRARAPL